MSDGSKFQVYGVEKYLSREVFDNSKGEYEVGG